MTRSAIPSRVAVLIPSLGRDNDHEVVATARAIGTALRSADLDWYDLAAALRVEPLRLAGRQTNAADVSDFSKACWCVDYGASTLTLKERQFVHDLSCRLGRLGGNTTDRQRQWLDAIYLRLRRAAA